MEMKWERELVITSNEKWFKFFVYLPKILTIITAVLVFVWSIVDPAVFQYKMYVGYYSSRYDILYGVMRLDTFFGAMIIWWAIGAVACILTYIFTKIMLSYSILHIYYLRDIRETNQKLVELKENEVKTENKE